MLINVLINRIYLYDSKITVIFNTQDKSADIEVSLIDEVESSLMGKYALPYFEIKTWYENIRFFCVIIMIPNKQFGTSDFNLLWNNIVSIIICEKYVK